MTFRARAVAQVTRDGSISQATWGTRERGGSQYATKPKRKYSHHGGGAMGLARTETEPVSASKRAHAVNVCRPGYHGRAHTVTSSMSVGRHRALVANCARLNHEFQDDVHLAQAQTAVWAVSRLMPGLEKNGISLAPPLPHCTQAVQETSWRRSGSWRFGQRGSPRARRHILAPHVAGKTVAGRRARFIRTLYLLNVKSSRVLASLLVSPMQPSAAYAAVGIARF